MPIRNMHKHSHTLKAHTSNLYAHPSICPHATWPLIHMHSLWFTCLTSIGPAVAFAFWSVGVTGCRRWLGYIYIHKTDGQPPPTTYLSPDYPPSLDDFEMQDSRWSGGKKSRAKNSCFHLLVRAIATFLFTLMGSVRAQRENKQQPLHLSADVLLKYSANC